MSTECWEEALDQWLIILEQAVKAFVVCIKRFFGHSVYVQFGSWEYRDLMYKILKELSGIFKGFDMNIGHRLFFVE